MPYNKGTNPAYHTPVTKWLNIKIKNIN